MASQKGDTFECLCVKGFVGEYCEKGTVDLIYGFLDINNVNVRLAQSLLKYRIIC